MERRTVCDILKIPEVASHGKYLGLPSEIGRSKAEIFQNIKDRIRKRIDGWSERNLSKAGKDVLIKSVFQAIPAYSMSCFLLPGFIIDDIKSMIGTFWWGGSEDKRKIHWSSWYRMARAKANGGLGFRDLEAQNLALLGKQAWRMLTNPSALLTRVYKDKYFSTSSIFNASLGSRPSWAWRSIHGGLHALTLGCQKHVGSGHTIRIYHDPWLPRDGSFFIDNPYRIPGHLRFVSDLIEPTTGRWNLDLLSSYFEQGDILEIKKIPLNGTGTRDFWRWHYTSSGKFTVKSLYHVLVEHPQNLLRRDVPNDPGSIVFWKALWKLKVPAQVQHFAWRFAKDTLPTTENLRRRTIQVAAVCPFCGDDNELTSHLFFQCYYSQQIFSKAGLLSQVILSRRNRGELWFKQILLDNEVETAELILMYCDAIWSQRNSKIFEDKLLDVGVLAGMVLNTLSSFRRANCWPERSSASLDPTYLLRPPEGLSRVSFDAGLRGGAAGLGVAISDGLGRFVRGATRKVNNVEHALLAGALAAYEAVLAASALPYPSVIVVDCLSLIQMIRGEAEPHVLVAHVVNEIQSSLLLNNLSPPYWIPRFDNSSAHLLALYDKSSDITFVSWDLPPPFIVSNDSGRFPGP